MKHRNYVKYSQMNKEENNEIVIDKTSIDNPEVKEEWVVTKEQDGVHVRPSINGEVIDTPIDKIMTQEELIEFEKDQNNEDTKQPEPIPAVVAGCAKLRVRRAPNADAGIYGTIDEGTELTVDNGEETYEDFYKVYTEINGTLIEGYCMKKFIKIK